MARIGRTLALLILTLCFLVAILKSLQKYYSGQVAVSSLTEVQTDFQFPSVTVCNMDNDWIAEADHAERGFRALVTDPDLGAPYVQGYLLAGEHSFIGNNLDGRPHFEPVGSAVVGSQKVNGSILQADRLCTTFNPRQSGSFDPGNSNTIGLGFRVPRHSSYFSVYVHEENAFVASQYHLFGMAMKKIRLVAGTEFVHKELTIKKSVAIKLPRKTAKCDENLSNKELKLSKCLVEHTQNRLGCRLPWINATSSETALCSDNKYSAFHEILGDMYYWSDKHIYEFGCRPSCQIINYEIEEDLEAVKRCNETPHCSNDNFNVVLVFQMNDPVVTTQTEVALYGFWDLVADIGGYLGLLLGASFLTIYELAEELFYKVASRYLAFKASQKFGIQSNAAE